MKQILTSILLFYSFNVFAQSKDEKKLEQLSSDIFRWEVQNKIDSLEGKLSDRFIMLNSAGVTQKKAEYIARLKSGNFVHNHISVEKNEAVVINNTGTVTGRGMFTITVNGKPSVIHLTYLEVFIRSSSGSGWELLALHASIVPN